MTEPVFETWGVDKSPVTIEYSVVVLEEIRHEVSQGLLKFSRGGIEVGGVMYGTRDGRKIRIEAIRPIQCDHARGPSFLLSPEDRANLEAQLAQDSQDPPLKDLVRVGWFVSHTRGELNLTESDLEIFSNYFRDPWQVTLVVRPGRANAMRAAFFVWEPDGTVKADQSYKEFAFPDRLAGVMDVPRAERPEPRTAPRAMPPLSQPPPAPPRVEPPRPATMPMFEASQYYPSPAPERRKWPFLVGGLAIIAVATLVGLYYWQPSQPEALGLLMTEREGQLQIQWNNTSRTIIRATKGSLEILDGTSSARVPLTRAQLADGRYLYDRKGGDVEVRMEVDSTDGTLRESSRFLGRPPAPEKPDELVLIEAQRDQLEQENSRLKAENAALSQRIQQLERTQRLLETRLGIVGEQK